MIKNNPSFSRHGDPEVLYVENEISLFATQGFISVEYFSVIIGVDFSPVFKIFCDVLVYLEMKFLNVCFCRV